MSTSRPQANGQVRTSRFAATLMDLLDRVEYRRVSPQEQFNPVFRLRYDAYRREEGVPFNTERVVREALDLVPNAMCYGVYIDGDLVSSLRLHHVTAANRRSPCMSVWSDVLDPLLDEGRTFIDPSRFTADRDATLAFPALPFLTLRIAAMACIHFEVDYCLSGVRDEHAAFYKRVFGSSQIAGQRNWDGLSFPVRLYAADVQDLRSTLFDRFPFFLSTPQEREILFGADADASYITAVAPTARAAAIAQNKFAPAAQ